MDDKANQNKAQPESKIVKISDEKPPILKPKNEEKHVVFTMGNFIALLGGICTIIAGAYFLGKDMGSNKFDTEKNRLQDSIYVLKDEVKAAIKECSDYKDSIENEEVIRQMDDAVTHDLHSIPAWEIVKKKLHQRRT
jgi:hypothetical protein